MSSSPEFTGRDRELRRNLPDNAGSHFVIGVLFGMYSVTHPRRVLEALKTQGLRKSYGQFYKSMRPYISYP